MTNNPESAKLLLGVFQIFMCLFVGLRLWSEIKLYRELKKKGPNGLRNYFKMRWDRLRGK